MILRRIVIVVAFLAVYVAGAAQQEVLRPVRAVWQLQGGTVHLANTYLSPLKYSGWGTGLTYRRTQAMKQRPEQWSSTLEFATDYSNTQNPAGNHTMMAANISAGWTMMWRWQPATAWQWGVGGNIRLDAGALYLRSNGNNPVQGQAALTVGPAAYATWSGRLGRLPIEAGCRASMPLLGAFFSPDYGELYYEIGLGDHSGLAHCAWPGSRRQFIGEATVDLKPGATAVRLGYRFDFLSAKANNITSRTIRHWAVVGVVCDWLSVNPNKPFPQDAKVIVAGY